MNWVIHLIMHWLVYCIFSGVYVHVDVYTSVMIHFLLQLVLMYIFCTVLVWAELAHSLLLMMRLKEKDDLDIYSIVSQNIVYICMQDYVNIVGRNVEYYVLI